MEGIAASPDAKIGRDPDLRPDHRGPYGSGRPRSCGVHVNFFGMLRFTENIKAQNPHNYSIPRPRTSNLDDVSLHYYSVDLDGPSRAGGGGVEST